MIAGSANILCSVSLRPFFMVSGCQWRMLPQNPWMDTELHRETDLENQMKTQAASHSFRDGS